MLRLPAQLVSLVLLTLTFVVEGQSLLQSPEIYLKQPLPRLTTEFLVETETVKVAQNHCEMVAKPIASTPNATISTLVKIQPHIFPLVSEDFLPSPILPRLQLSTD